MIFPSPCIPTTLPHSGVAVVIAALASVAGLSAQELEPRRWGHLPLDSNFAGICCIRTEGEIAFDLVLRLEDVVSKDMGDVDKANRNASFHML